MANKKNKNKSAEKISKETQQPEGKVEVNAPSLEERANKLESLGGELQDRADELNGREEKIAKQEANLNDWAKELAERAKKGKVSKQDATYAKKLSNCFLNGSVEEYIRTSAEQFGGEARNNFLNAIIDGAEAVKANT